MWTYCTQQSHSLITASASPSRKSLQLLDSQQTKILVWNHWAMKLTLTECYFRMALNNYEQFRFLLTVKPGPFQWPFKVTDISENFKIIKGILAIRQKKYWVNLYSRDSLNHLFNIQIDWHNTMVCIWLHTTMRSFFHRNKICKENLFHRGTHSILLCNEWLVNISNLWLHLEYNVNI